MNNFFFKKENLWESSFEKFEETLADIHNKNLILNFSTFNEIINSLRLNKQHFSKKNNNNTELKSIKLLEQKKNGLVNSFRETVCNKFVEVISNAEEFSKFEIFLQFQCMNTKDDFIKITCEQFPSLLYKQVHKDLENEIHFETTLKEYREYSSKIDKIFDKYKSDDVKNRILKKKTKDNDFLTEICNEIKNEIELKIPHEITTELNFQNITHKRLNGYFLSGPLIPNTVKTWPISSFSSKVIALKVILEEIFPILKRFKNSRFNSIFRMFNSDSRFTELTNTLIKAIKSVKKNQKIWNRGKALKDNEKNWKIFKSKNKKFSEVQKFFIKFMEEIFRNFLSNLNDTETEKKVEKFVNDIQEFTPLTKIYRTENIEDLEIQKCEEHLNVILKILYETSRKPSLQNEIKTQIKNLLSFIEKDYGKKNLLQKLEINDICENLSEESSQLLIEYLHRVIRDENKMNIVKNTILSLIEKKYEKKININEVSTNFEKNFIQLIKILRNLCHRKFLSEHEFKYIFKLFIEVISRIALVSEYDISFLSKMKNSIICNVYVEHPLESQTNRHKEQERSKQIYRYNKQRDRVVSLCSAIKESRA